MPNYASATQCKEQNHSIFHDFAHSIILHFALFYIKICQTREKATFQQVTLKVQEMQAHLKTLYFCIEKKPKVWWL